MVLLIRIKHKNEMENFGEKKSFFSIQPFNKLLFKLIKVLGTLE